MEDTAYFATDTAYMSTQARDAADVDVYVFRTDQFVASCCGLKFYKTTCKALTSHFAQAQASNYPGNTQMSARDNTVRGTRASSAQRFNMDIQDPVARSGCYTVPETTIIHLIQRLHLSERGASETGCLTDELNAATTFPEIVIDLLLSIAVTSQTQRELGLALPDEPFSTTIYPSIMETRQHFGIDIEMAIWRKYAIARACCFKE